MNRYSSILSYWKGVMFILTPIILLPIPLAWQPAQGAVISRTLYVILIMAVYWVTEVVPLTVTALVPLLAFPVLKITTAKEVATHYLTDSSWLFIGSLVVAVAVENTGLHRRIALNILRMTGSQPRWLMFGLCIGFFTHSLFYIFFTISLLNIFTGIMVCTSLLSMFISNTATTAMMMPVVVTLASELIRTDRMISAKQHVEDHADNSGTGHRLSPISLRKADKVGPKDEIQLSVRCIAKSNGTHTQENGEILDIEDQDDHTNANLNSVIMERSQLSPSELRLHILYENQSSSFHRLTKALLLATSYAASLGGTATLTGTPPNIVMKGLLDDRYGVGHPINYATWIGYNGPGLIINILFAWHWLQLLFFGPRALVSCKKQSVAASTAVKNVIAREVAALGRWTFAELSVLCWFALALLLWLTRELAGWGPLFNTEVVENVTDPSGSVCTDVKTTIYVSDGTCIMFVCLILFIWPRKLPIKRMQSDDSPGQKLTCITYQPLLTWQNVHEKLPWGVVFLLGGGFALAKAAQKSGLSGMIACQLAQLNLSQFWTCVLSLVLMTYMTEFTSNTATSQIVLPITMDLAQKRGFNPLYLTMPVSEAASFAYMLPVATPPNAIVFSSGVFGIWEVGFYALVSSGLLTVVDMMAAGFVMNLFCMLEVLLSIHTWGWHMFNIETYPQWAVHSNATGNCANLTSSM